MIQTCHLLHHRKILAILAALAQADYDIVVRLLTFSHQGLLICLQHSNEMKADSRTLQALPGRGIIITAVGSAALEEVDTIVTNRRLSTSCQRRTLCRRGKAK